MSAPEQDGTEPYEPPELTEHGTVEELTKVINPRPTSGLYASAAI